MYVGMSWLLTCRGIPQMYYGMEVLMPGLTSPNDGHVRKDFPGGWPGDRKNAFTGEGLTQQEKEFQEFTKSLALYRKNSSALKTGRMMQFVPEDGVYVYFRYDERQTVMVVMNTNEKEKQLNPERFQERTKGFLIAKDALGTASLDLRQNWRVPGMACWVLELR
jgi:glycosidase